MKIDFSPPDITQLEIDEVIDTLKSGWITTGPKTKLFENKLSGYCGTERTVCLNSATSAMELVLRVLDIGPGDEVITTAFTYTASASVIHHVGAKIVLVDTIEDSLEMDYDQLENLINPNTKAIIAVDVAGIMCDYDKIIEILTKKKSIFSSTNDILSSLKRVALISDAAHSLGATYKKNKSGNIADFTCFSFHAVKNLTTAEGGAVTWNLNHVNNSDLYDLFMLYSLHGQNKDAFSKSKVGKWEYDIILPGYKCNMTDISASLGLAQLSRYEKTLEYRKNIIKKYNKLFSGSCILPINHFHDWKTSSFHLYIVRIPGISEENRNKIIEKMSIRGIPCNVHYKPLPLFTAYKSLGFNIEGFPNSMKIYEQIITLPVHNNLSIEDTKYIAYNLLEITNGVISDE